MARISITLDWKLTEYVQKLSADMRPAIRRKIERLAPQVAAVARAKAPKKSGRLAAGVDSDTYSTKTGEWGKVTVAGPYAHFTEAGFHGTEAIRTHYRTIKKIFGRPIRPTRAMIRAHSRGLNVEGDGFARAALAESEGAIRAELSDAIDGVLAR